MNRVSLVGGLILFAWPAFGQAQNSLTAQERSDVVFRTLSAYPFNTHSAIYIDFLNLDTSQSANPQDLSKHPVVQMTGVTSAPLGVVSAVSYIQKITLQNFETSAGFFGSYLGAYDNINQGAVISRGKAADTSMSRMAILNTANALFNRNPQITYVMVVGDFLPDVKFKYMNLFETALSPTSYGIGDIENMRSDAFVEYAYAANGFPILNVDMSNPAGLAILQDEAAAGNLTPNNQLAALVGAIIEAPTMTVMDQNGNTIADGAASNTQSVQVKVEDFFSGPGWIEISKDGTFLGANSGLTNGNYSGAADGTSRTFTSNELSALGNLADGNYTIRALDQAGNEVKSRFKVATDDSSTRMA